MSIVLSVFSRSLSGRIRRNTLMKLVASSLVVIAGTGEVHVVEDKAKDKEEEEEEGDEEEIISGLDRGDDSGDDLAFFDAFLPWIRLKAAIGSCMTNEGKEIVGSGGYLRIIVYTNFFIILDCTS